MYGTVYVQAEPDEIYFHIHEIVRLFFPGVLLARGNEGMPCFTIQRVNRNGKVLFRAGWNDGMHCKEKWAEYGNVNENTARRLARIFTLDALTEVTGAPPPSYGILTGIRPTKLVHRMLDGGAGKTEIVTSLIRDYKLATVKAELLYTVACEERPFLKEPKNAAPLVSVYVGVPYCPSRCFYCSFPSTQLIRPEEELDGFLQALQQEIAGVAAGIEQLGLQVENLYLGGGTPSILGAGRLEQLIRTLKGRLPLQADLEFTVEAGRPDTIDEAMIATLQVAGVNRICINPQTMNDETLERVGRLHTSQAVRTAVEWVRAAGIPILNMDVIVGLPGEGYREWAHTLEELLYLRPENITVHTLAAKKGSPLTEAEGVGRREPLAGSGVALFAQGLAPAGYEPYYLYRQKNMRSDEENVGYTLPGQACRYNIQVIEERQSIIGLGGGAGSKYVRVRDWTLTASYNPKNPEVYLTSIPRLVTTKVDKLRSLNIE